MSVADRSVTPNIGVPAWRGLSKTVGGESLKPFQPTQMVLPIRTESDTKAPPGPAGRNGNIQE
ncbi:hypothetical protein GCM10017624_11810 [Azotobacter vinelandii]|nr:hypothetical protein GCM10017624_11810 [Azotobacter vinelandii]